MTKSIHVAITLSILTAAAGCADPLDRDFFHTECGPEQVGWFDEDGDATCAELDAPDSRGEPNEPPEPPPAPETGDLDPLCVNETPIEPLPDPIYDDRRPERALDLARAPAPGPVCPADQYLTDIRFFSGPLLVGGRRLGEHSATRITQWKATWDATLKNYKVAEVKHNDHGNHGPGPDDGNMIMYRVPIVTGWTVAGGLGETAYDRTINKYCQCPGEGPHPHATASDSCYGYIPNDHVCHSDTRYQEIIFRNVSGNGIVPRNECGTGLWTRFAP